MNYLRYIFDFFVKKDQPQDHNNEEFVLVDSNDSKQTLIKTEIRNSESSDIGIDEKLMNRKNYNQKKKKKKSRNIFLKN
jgi:hypothetical protein